MAEPHGGVEPDLLDLDGFVMPMPGEFHDILQPENQKTPSSSLQKLFNLDPSREGFKNLPHVPLPYQVPPYQKCPIPSNVLLYHQKQQKLLSQNPPGVDHGKSPMNSSANDRIKPGRRRWNPELHARFLEAVNTLGGDKQATPKSIQREMDENGLTIPQIKSHLQKFRRGGGSTRVFVGGKGKGKGKKKANAQKSNEPRISLEPITSGREDSAFWDLIDEVLANKETVQMNNISFGNEMHQMSKQAQQELQPQSYGQMLQMSMQAQQDLQQSYEQMQQMAMQTQQDLQPQSYDQMQQMPVLGQQELQSQSYDQMQQMPVLGQQELQPQSYEQMQQMPMLEHQELQPQSYEQMQQMPMLAHQELQPQSYEQMQQMPMLAHQELQPQSYEQMQQMPMLAHQELQLQSFEQIQQMPMLAHQELQPQSYEQMQQVPILSRQELQPQSYEQMQQMPMLAHQELQPQSYEQMQQMPMLAHQELQPQSFEQMEQMPMLAHQELQQQCYEQMEQMPMLAHQDLQPQSFEMLAPSIPYTTTGIFGNVDHEGTMSDAAFPSWNSVPPSIPSYDPQAPFGNAQNYANNECNTNLLAGNGMRDPEDDIFLDLFDTIDYTILDEFNNEF